MLHTINKSPFETSTMETCSRFLQPGDAVLFIEDGVYAAQEGNRFSADIRSIMEKSKVYALRPDLEARGIDRITEGIGVVDYQGFVSLVEEHQVNSWF